MKPKLKTALLLAIVLFAGLIVGYLFGRFTLERQWSQPYTQAGPPPTGAPDEINPSPTPGTKVLKAMPIAKSRAALASMTGDDPVVSHVAAVGWGANRAELHVVVESHAKCTVTSLGGVAYGFDPLGMPAPLNKGGATYVAFTSKTPLEPGKTTTIAAPLKGIEDATLAIAQIDRTTCADGTTWARR
jgi:hypothetical protein